MKLLLVLILATVGQAATCITHIPPGKHTDYIWPFNHLPRTIDAWPSCKPPKTLIGNDHDQDGDDVPDPGHRTLQFSLRYGLMFSFQTKKRILFRIGTMRYDFVDHYYVWPFTFRLNRHRDN